MTPTNDGIRTKNPTQIPIEESNPMLTWAFAPSNLQNMHHMKKYSNYKKSENIFPQ
jgi:hypothetical protein